MCFLGISSGLMGKPMEQLLHYNPFTNEPTDRGKITPLNDSQLTISISHTFKGSLLSQGLSHRTKVTQETFSSQLPLCLKFPYFAWLFIYPAVPLKTTWIQKGVLRTRAWTTLLLINRASDHTQCPQLSADTGDGLVPMPGHLGSATCHFLVIPSSVRTLW